MDIRGIQRVRSFFGGIVDGRQKSVDSSSDRDAHRDQLQERRKNLRLSKEQEDEAFQSLIKSLSGTELHAERKEDESGTVFLVINTNNQVVRELRGLLITDIYLHRFDSPDSSGTLLRRSA